jgi:hypothetical protein
MKWKDGRGRRMIGVAAGVAIVAIVATSATWAMASEDDSSPPPAAVADEGARRELGPASEAETPQAETSSQAQTSRPVLASPSPWHVAARRPLPRIVSRPDGLYVGAGGPRFVARGANYTRLARDSAGTVYHSTFQPGVYDSRRATAFLDQMQHDGYNTVRVFIDPGDAAGEHGIGGGMKVNQKLAGAYMDNVANFISAAENRGIYTMPSLDEFPTNSYYWGIVGRAGGGNPQNMDGRNLSYMEGGRVEAKSAYVANFATALADRIGAQRRTAVLAYQSDNEAFFETNKAPFNKMSGDVTPFNGITYHMNDKFDRQQSADASIAEYSVRLKRALAAVEPDALLAMGFFSYQAVGKQGPDGFAKFCASGCASSGEYWYPARAGILSYWGAIDLIDVHMYEHHGRSVLDALEMSNRKDPYIIGELGALKSAYGNDIVRAANGMREVEKEACALGAQGYLYFTWDTTEPLASLEKFFHLSEQGGAINGQLAPLVRPDPCR